MKTSKDLINNYDDISTLCHTLGEPVFITKNGKVDLVVMSIEAYNEINAKQEEIYAELLRDLKDIIK